MNSILIADDHMLFREGLQSIIKHWDDFEVCAEVSNGVDAVKKANELLPDIILMDIHMPVMDGIEATRRISKELPAIKIVMLTMSEDEENLFTAIQCGAQGYVLKDTPSRRLHDELRRLSRGEAPLSGLMAQRILMEFRELRQNPHSALDTDDELTRREIEILEYVVKGDSNTEIASALNISENTVKLHLKNILEKLHLRNRIQAAVFAVKQGLVKDTKPPE
jgi:DNA-binding NarL/FixJ family response regulator